MRKFIIPLTFFFALALQGTSYSQDQLTAKGGFSVNADEEHYFLFVLNNRPADLPEVRASITKYIWKHYPKAHLKLTQIKVDGDLQNVPMIHVKGFKDKAEAMAFYAGLKKNRPDFLMMGMTKDYFAISKRNYESIVRSKSLAGYKPFFESNY
ncbi:MAG TPA: hypothetical protein ENJ95_02410 [Bacteroidetes bacterium]|nr:hypothetical protein [Bacteroidota bacterium]